jgi:hypothetical protein
MYEARVAFALAKQDTSAGVADMFSAGCGTGVIKPKKMNIMNA